MMSSMDEYDARFLDEDHRFHAGYLTEERADLEAAEVLGLLDLDGPSRVIDAGCGDGRIAVRLASLGHDVVAIDADPGQVGRAARLAAARGVDVDLRVADLTTLVVDPPADAALLWFTTFGFLSDPANAAVLDNLRRGLVDGAKLLIDTLDPSVVAEELEADPAPVLVVDGGWTQEDRRHFDRSSSRLVVDRVVTGPTGRSVRRLQLWLPSRHLWPTVLETAGFRLLAVEEPPDDAWAIRLVAAAGR